MSHIQSLYIHFPYCRHLCNFCDFYKMKWDTHQDDQSAEQFSKFHHSIQKSWEHLAPFFQQHPFCLGPLETFYIGGGTPSLWNEEGVLFLKQFFQDLGLTFSPHYEWTLEVDPYQWSKKILQQWVAAGVNRFSVGIQSMNPQVLKKLDRQQSLEEQYELLAFCRDIGINYSVDFILGAPYHERDIRQEIEQIALFRPRHYSFYLLSVGKGYPLHQHLPDDEVTADEYLTAISCLKKFHIYQYEVSNFAFPGYESRHNWAYWRQKPVLALGASGSGFMPLKDNKASRYRIKASSFMPEWDHLGPAERKLETLYLSLRTIQGLNPSILFDIFAYHPSKEESIQIETLFRGWLSEGLIKGKNGGKVGYPVVLSEKGLLILDTLIHQFIRVCPHFFQ
jgi:oxygen-independent coproporphyrinogen-3 oxidase